MASFGAKKGVYRKVEKRCEVCHKVSMYYPSQIKHSGGRFCSMKCRNDWQSWRMSGERNHKWVDGRTKERRRWYNSRGNVAWRKFVFERDGYTCQVCGVVGGELNAHHIAPVSKHPELREDKENGVTLCKVCHDLIPKRYMPDVVFIPTKTYNEMLGEMYDLIVRMRYA